MTETDSIRRRAEEIYELPEGHEQKARIEAILRDLVAETREECAKEATRAINAFTYTTGAFSWDDLSAHVAAALRQSSPRGET